MKRPPAGMAMFDNTLLSDVTIRQTLNGNSKDYRAHRAILCASSTWFMKAFSGRFTEATNRVVEVHDDDPKHFEVMLQYMYTHRLNDSPLKDSSSKGFYAIRYTFELMGVHAVAGKYGIMGLQAIIAEQLPTFGTVGERDTRGLLELHYEHCMDDECLVGQKLITLFRVANPAFPKTVDCDTLVKTFPKFAVDLYLVARQRGGRLW